MAVQLLEGISTYGWFTDASVKQDLTSIGTHGWWGTDADLHGEIFIFDLPIVQCKVFQLRAPGDC